MLPGALLMIVGLGKPVLTNGTQQTNPMETYNDHSVQNNP